MSTGPPVIETPIAGGRGSLCDPGFHAFSRCEPGATSRGNSAPGGAELGETDMSSGNIVERLRAMAAHLDQFRRDKVEDELSEAADVIERLRAELDRMEQRLARAGLTDPSAGTASGSTTPPGA